MDTAVALVQAYLNVNGYFTVVEYPVLEARQDHARVVTDLDVLAFRFAGAGHTLGATALGAAAGFAPDPRLGCPPGQADMIVGEVKEGAARFNPATRDPAVLQVALARFGCCGSDDAPELARRLVRRGQAQAGHGHVIRMVAFGGGAERSPGRQWLVVPMRHVVQFLRDHLRAHWDVLRHAQIKDPVLGVLALLEKWECEDRRPPGAAGRRSA